GFGGTFRLGAGGSNSTATWQVNNLNPNALFEVSTTWVAGPDRATNLQYQVFNNNTLLEPLSVNKQQAPVRTAFNGPTVQKVGNYTFTSGVMKVVISAAGANGNVVADAAGVAFAIAGGGGISQFETQPGYQVGTVSAFSNARRTIPDVALDAG